MRRATSKIDDALASLRNQGIHVGEPIVGPQGFMFNVGGFMLTQAEVLALKRRGRLHWEGIKEYAVAMERSIQKVP